MISLRLIAKCFTGGLSVYRYWLSVLDLVDDDCDGTVAGNVAGCAEAVHCDVEGDHQGLGFLVEAEH